MNSRSANIVFNYKGGLEFGIQEATYEFEGYLQVLYSLE